MINIGFGEMYGENFFVDFFCVVDWVILCSVYFGLLMNNFMLNLCLYLFLLIFVFLLFFVLLVVVVEKFCVFYFYFKDFYWLLVNYGMVEEVCKFNFNLCVMEVGGYLNYYK